MVIPFRNHCHIKMWKIFSNAKQTSPTSTLRKHFQNEHTQVWESESRHFGVPQKSRIGQVIGSSVEQFTHEGLMVRLQKFIVGDDQVCLQLFSVSFHFTHQIMQSINVIDNPHFRELLLYLGQGCITDGEIPGRTHLTQSIMQAWREEREQFHQEMKVCWTWLLY